MLIKFAINKNDVYLQCNKRLFLSKIIVYRNSFRALLCHCLSEVRGTHDNKSGPIIGLLREACSYGS